MDSLKKISNVLTHKISIFLSIEWKLTFWWEADECPVVGGEDNVASTDPPQ